MRTFIIAILCIWGINTFALTPNETIINHAEVKNIQPHPHRKQPSRHHQAMSPKDFQFMYKIIKKKNFDNDRLEILSVGVLDNYFTCQQCARLMSLYSFDDNKLKILRIMTGHIVDLENHHDILKELDFDSSKQKAIDILGIRH